MSPGSERAASSGRPLHGFIALAGLLVLAVALIPNSAGADSTGGQASAYSASRRARSCTVYTPQLTTDGAALLNQSNQVANVRMEVRPLGTTARYVRDMRLGANTEQELAGRIPNLPRDFLAGSFKASVVQVTTPTAIPSLTPVPASTPIPEPESTEVFEPLEIAQVTDSSGAQSVPTLNPSVGNPCGLAGVVFDDSAIGDRWALETFTDNDVADTVYVPLFHHADLGFNTQVIIQNVGTRDASATLTFRSDSGEEAEETLQIRSSSSLAVPLTEEVPTGASSLVIEGSGDARLMAAAYHTGPRGMAAADLGSTAGASRVALPLLFRGAGQENGYSSRIRVVALADAPIPRITFRDRESGERIGPISATRDDGSPRVLREGEGYTWNLPDMRQLQDGRIYSAEVDNQSGRDMAVIVENVNTRRGTLATYIGVPITGDPPRELTAPVVMKNRDGLNSSIQLQNLTSNGISVAVRFFNTGGTRVATKSVNVLAQDAATVYLPSLSLPDNFAGWAEIAGSGAVAAVVTTVRYR